MSMGAKKRIKSILLYGVMALYIILLFILLLFGYSSPIGGFGGIRGGHRSLNVVPFRTISAFFRRIWRTMRLPGSDAINNIFGNVVVFIPCGMYVAILRKNKGILASLLCVFPTSLFFELLQFIFARGACDIDDIILNCLGGLVGILVYKGLVYFMKDEEKARSAVAVCSVIIGVPTFAFILKGIIQLFLDLGAFHV